MKFNNIHGLQFTTANIVLSEKPENSIATGQWETSEIQLCRKYVKSTDTILELGACIGVVSCVTNKMLDVPENHVAVEANPETAKVLAVNKKKNNAKFGIENCLVFREHSGKFYPASGAPQSGSTMIHNDGLKTKNQFDFDVVQLPTITIEELETKYQKKFNVLIMDIEGGEFQFIKENQEFLERLDLTIIEFHHRFNITGCSHHEYRQAIATLQRCGLVELKNTVNVRGKIIEGATEVWGRP